MLFRIGAHVVHPQHGVAVVDRFERRKTEGGMGQYIVLRIDSQALSILVPAATAEALGVRSVMTEIEGREMLETLARPARMPKNWARRFKNHSEKLRSGDRHDEFVVLRNLWVLSQQRELSPGEQQMLRRVRGLVLPELVLAFDECLEDVEERLDALMAGRSTAQDLAS